MKFKIEEYSMNAWPALNTYLYDGWIIRFSNGYTKRANSINLINKSKINIIEKIEFCEKLFKNQKLPVVYKIIGTEESKEIDLKLESLNYEKIDLTSVQILNHIPVYFKKSINLIIESKFTDDWIYGLINCSKINLEHTETVKAMLKNILSDVIVVQVRHNNEIIGCGYGAIEDEYVGIFDIIVKEEHRRKGYGKEIVENILREAADRGISKSYLQVVSNNYPAVKLYKDLGFEEYYKYWYRRKVV